jgi:hypothetical protein
VKFDSLDVWVQSATKRTKDAGLKAEAQEAARVASQEVLHRTPASSHASSQFRSRPGGRTSPPRSTPCLWPGRKTTSSSSTRCPALSLNSTLAKTATFPPPTCLRT